MKIWDKLIFLYQKPPPRLNSPRAKRPNGQKQEKTDESTAGVKTTSSGQIFAPTFTTTAAVWHEKAAPRKEDGGRVFVLRLFACTVFCCFYLNDQRFATIRANHEGARRLFEEFSGRNVQSVAKLFQRIERGLYFARGKTANRRLRNSYFGR